MKNYESLGRGATCSSLVDYRRDKSESDFHWRRTGVSTVDVGSRQREEVLRESTNCYIGSLWSELDGKWYLCASKSNRLMPTAWASDSENELIAEFELRADRWERESAVHSAPGATFLYRDYVAIIGKGMSSPETIVPLILKRLQISGSNWFFALQLIAGENPAEKATNFETAYNCWIQWALERGIIDSENEVR